MSIIKKGTCGKRKSFSRETGQLETVVRPFSVPSFFVPQEMAALPLCEKRKKRADPLGLNSGGTVGIFSPRSICFGVLFFYPGTERKYNESYLQ